MQPTPLIGSAISATSMSQPFGAYGPSAQQSYGQPAAGGGGTQGGGSVAGGIGYLGASALGAFSGLSSSVNSNGINTPSSAADIYAMQQGAGKGTIGNISTAVSGASLINKATGGAGNSLGAGLGAAGGALQMVQGIQQGGVLGYGGAVVGGLRAGAGVSSLLGDSALSGTLGAAAGYIAAPLALYSAIKNWQSGSTGSDTLQGAEAGAAIGSVVPGIGTLIGGVIGGVVGAVSSAFGGGKTSAEATQAQSVDKTLQGASAQERSAAIGSMSAPQAFQTINGYMNAHDNSPGHSEPIQQVFGKDGVGNMVGQMLPQINAAIAKNPALKSLTPAQLYSQVVSPWLTSKGATISTTSVDKNGNNEGQNLADAVTNIIGQWQSGSFNSNTSMGVAGEKITVPAYG